MSASRLWNVLDNVPGTKRISDDLGIALDRASKLWDVLENLPEIDSLITQLARARELAERLGLGHQRERPEGVGAVGVR